MLLSTSVAASDVAGEGESHVGGVLAGRSCGRKESTTLLVVVGIIGRLAKGSYQGVPFAADNGCQGVVRHTGFD